MSAQSHGAAKECTCCTRSLPYHFADVAPHPSYVTAFEAITLDIRCAGQSMLYALGQQHQIAIVQLLPSLGFGMDPAWTLADKVETKQRLRRKGDAPGMPELAAPVIDPAQAKVLQDFAQRIHWDI